MTMVVRVLIIFLGAQMFSATSVPQTLQTRDEAVRIDREAILTDFDGRTPAINQQGGRILTASKTEAPTRDSDENKQMVTCDRWYMSIDGRMKCLLMKYTSSPSNDIVVSPENLNRPMHVYLPGLPSFGLPFWSSSSIDRTPSSPLYGISHPKGEENDSKPARGHEELLQLKPVILEPVHIVPKPIVVHKPVLVPKPVEITVHKPVLVHKPIEIHKPAVIHKPVEIPIHKPVFVQKPLAITIHKPVLVHKPIQMSAEHNHESLLSQILKQHITHFHIPQNNHQDAQGVGPHKNMHAIESPGYGGLHPAGFVSALDSGKDTIIQDFGSQPSGDYVFQNLFSVAPQLRPDALAPSPVKEVHTDIGATDKTSSVEHSDSSLKSQTDRVVEGVIGTITQNNEELEKSILSEGDDEDSKTIDTIPDEFKFGSPNEHLRETLSSIISTNLELNGSQIPLHDHNSPEKYLLDEGETASSSENFEYERIDPSLPPPTNSHEMASETESIDSEMIAGMKLDEGPDVMEDAHKEEEGEELTRTIREAHGVPSDDISRDKQQAGTILDRTTLLEIMTALKDQYSKNAEPDQRKVIEDAFDRLYRSARDMKQLSERPNWKKIDGSKKAALELLTERAPVDVDEWDYYSDAADDVNVEPSFLELLNVATKHIKGNGLK